MMKWATREPCPSEHCSQADEEREMEHPILGGMGNAEIQLAPWPGRSSSKSRFETALGKPLRS